MAELKVDEFVGTIAEHKLLLKTVDAEVDRLYADACLRVRSQRAMIDDKFKRALFADAVVTGEDELERMYVKAYADGHSCGLMQIAHEFDELDDLVADILKLRSNLKRTCELAKS